MSTKQILEDFLRKHGLTSVVNFRYGADDSTRVILEIQAKAFRPRASRGFTSTRQLTHLTNRLAKNDVSLTWVIVGTGEMQDLAEALQKQLQFLFGPSLTVTSLSTLGSATTTIIIQTSESRLISSKYQGIRQFCEMLLNGYGVRDVEVIMEDGEEIPSDLMILRRIKILSPVSSDALAEKLIPSTDRNSPTVKILSGKLDTLRKKGMLLRREDGKYVLTLKGIWACGGATTRNSSDVARALVLGRRKW